MKSGTAKPSGVVISLPGDPPPSPEQRRAWNLLQSELADARAHIHELEKRIKALEHQTAEAHPTVLTRPEFNREVARMLTFDERYGGTSSILYFNLENMGDIADRHGKSVVNAAIREIMNILTKQVRGSDIVGRLAPDEFGILLVRCSNADAWTKGRRIVETVANGLGSVHGCAINPQISYGAYTFREDEDLATGLREVSRMITRPD